MKCALEYENMRNEAIAVYEQAEAFADMVALMEYEKLRNRTIEWCDTVLDEFFTNQAKNRQPLSGDWKVVTTKNRCGQTIIRFIVPSGTTYANGDLSYDIDNTEFAFDIMKEYLEELCFIVEFDKKHWHTYRCYGVGKQECDMINIRTNSCK